MLTRLYEVSSRRSRAANSKVSGGILPKFELIQAFIVVLVTCKNEEVPIKTEGVKHGGEACGLKLEIPGYPLR